MTEAVVYVRISDDREGTGLGVARQEKDCRALCDREGWTVAEVIDDNDISAYSGRLRPGYKRLMEGISEHRWDAVVAWHPDRLHRSPKELESFIDLIEQSGVTVATVTAGNYDLSTATGRMSARVVGAVARHASEQAAERIRRKHREIAEAGRLAGGGTRPFGYLEDRTSLHPDEAPLVAEAARAILDGVPLRGVVRDWQARGIRTVTGTPWTSTVLRRILTSPRSAAIREHAGKQYPGTWPPLLDEVTWRRVRAVLLDPTRRSNHTSRTYLLTGGLAVCGLCAKPLVSRPRSDGARSYVCASGPGFHGCGKIRIKADPFEDDIVTAVAGQLTAATLPKVTEDATGILLQIEAAEASLAELASDYYTDRSISRQQFQAASATGQAKLNRLRSEAASLERRHLPTDALAILEGPPDPRRRAVIEAMVEQVTVGPAVRGRNFYDPERVSITWLA